MYKVLFAEDEVLVRLGLKNSVNWEQFDMEVVADEDNGVDAWEKFRECRPDLVITDIKMPGMDGCELIRRIREEDKECGIIILSCLDDFKILQNMISYNILGYLLKASMTMDEIHKQLADSKEYLDKVKRHTGNQEDKLPRPEVLLSEYVIYKNRSLAELKTGLSRSGKRLLPCIKAIILFEIDSANREKISGLGLHVIQDMVCEGFTEGLLLLIDDDRFAFLLPEETEEDEEKVTTVVAKVRTVFNIALQYFIHATKNSNWECLPNEYRLCLEERVTIGEEMQTRIPDYNINKAVEYMKARYFDQITLNEVAEVAGLSPNYFSALFKREMNISFISFLTTLRVERAMELLKNSGEYLYVVAEKSGFQNFEHFSRIFKQRTGKSPANWRKENRKGQAKQ